MNEIVKFKTPAGTLALCQDQDGKCFVGSGTALREVTAAESATWFSRRWAEYVGSDPAWDVEFPGLDVWLAMMGRCAPRPHTPGCRFLVRGGKPCPRCIENERGVA